MGNNNCCCPETEEGAGDAGDAYGAHNNSDVAPLLHDAAGGSQGDLAHSLGGDSGGGDPFYDHHRVGGGASFQVGSSLRSPAVFANGGMHAQQPGNRVQQRLDEILQQASKQIIDCSVDGGISGLGDPVKGAAAADAQERSAAYGKRLSAVAAQLAARHATAAATATGPEALSESGGGLRAEKMSRQAGERMLGEGDHLLVTEVGVHSGRVAAVDGHVRAHQDIIMPFGRSVLERLAGGGGGDAVAGGGGDKGN